MGEPVGVAQAEIVGKPRFRHIWIRPQIGHPKDFATRRIPRVVGALNETTGDMEFRPIREVTGIQPSDLPHLPMEDASHVDLAFQGPSLKTARKKGVCTTGVDTGEVIRNRGGNPDYRPPKRKGFFFKSTPEELMEERRRKMLEARRQIQYQAHP